MGGTKLGAHDWMMIAVSWFGGEEMLRALVLEDGMSVDVRDEEGRTPLMLAIDERGNYVDAPRWLVDLGADVNAVNKRGTTPLMYAAKSGCLDVVRLLVDAGADVNATNQHGLTPLMSATIYPRNTDIVRYLVDAGADVNPAPLQGMPLLIRLMNHVYDWNEDVEIVRYLMDAGSNVNAASEDGVTPLMLSVILKQLDLARTLIDAGADPNAADRMGQTPLMIAAQCGSLDITRFLVEAGAELESIDNDGKTPLLWAAQNNNADVFRYLIQQGGNVNAVPKGGFQTALMCAAGRDVADVQSLLDAGADVNVTNSSGSTPLMSAARNKLDVVCCLVEAGADVNLADNRGWTALMEAVAGSMWDNVQYLIEAGADVNATREDGGTALTNAALRIDLDTLRCFVDAGADVNAADQFGRTALSWAVGNSIDVAQFLIDAGAKVNPLTAGTAFVTPLVGGASRGNLEMVNFLLDRGADVNAADQHGVTTLMAITDRIPSSEVVASLIDAGADVNAVDDSGRSCLMYAADCYATEMIEQLTFAGADVDAAREDGRTVLMDAAERGGPALVQCLLNCGANASQVDRHGQTAVYFAARHGHLAIQHLLASHIVRSQETTHDIGRLTPASSSWMTMSWFIPPFEVTLLTAGDASEYKAKWFDADVVVKLFIPGASPTSFEEQVAVWHQLRHPNVTKLYGACTIGHHFFVCEFVGSGSITEYFGACDRSGIPRTPWKLLFQAALGLAYLHERRILHGNLRPSNILVGSEGLAKLSDFGMSGTTAATSGVFGQKRWHSPEQLKGGQASFASDIYCLGLCTFEVVTGASPWDREWFDGAQDGQDWDPCTRPDNGAPGPLADKDVRFLMTRMCGQDPASRVDASTAVRMLERLATTEATTVQPLQPEPEPLLQIEEYRDGKLTRTWSKICLVESEAALQGLSRFIFRDLEAVYERLSNSRQSWEILRQFDSLLEDFGRAVAIGSHQNRILRLSSTRATSSNLEMFRRRINTMWTMLDGSDSMENNQTERWEEQRKHQMEVFVSEVSRTLLVTNEVASEEDRIAFQALLQGEIDAHGADYSDSQLAVMQQAHDDLSKQGDSEVVVAMPPWFLPWYELVIDTSDWLGDGGFGNVYRAKWLDSEVVVKQVKMHGSSNTSYLSGATTLDSESTHYEEAASMYEDGIEKRKMRRMFEREAGIWFGLSHPHVVRLFGACHVGTPFFACEYASHGSLDKYLRNHPEEVWEKLFEASVGIQYLHARGVIHGDLKCNNIVVGSDGKAKVTDFGLSSSAALSGKDNAELTGAWHWVAPECLKKGAPEQSTASDVYSLGMCIVEALRVISTTAMGQNEHSHALLPWGNMDNTVVKHYVVREHRLPLRPDQCSDEQWTLVEKMCAHNPADRLKIGNVVDELAVLAGIQLRDGADTTLRSPLVTSQHIQALIADMRRSSHSDAVCPTSSDQRVLRQIHELLWTRLEHLVDKNPDRAESLGQFIDKAASSVPDLQKSSVTLVQFTEHSLQGYSLHRDLDKLMDAKRWRIEEEDAEHVHDWKAKCYDFLGVH